MMVSVVYRCGGVIVGRAWVRRVVVEEVAYVACWQARIREALVLAETEHGDRIAAGFPPAKVCTAGPLAVSGERCGRPAVTGFVSSAGEEFYECAVHDGRIQVLR